MNAYIKFGENMSVSSQDIERNKNLGANQMCKKMACDNHKLDLANIIAYIKFAEFLSITSQDIEREQNFGVNKGP